MSDPGMKKSTCYAPVFSANHFFACIFISFFYILLAAMIILATFGLILLCAAGQCLIKGFLYRAKYCTVGNNDSNKPI